MMQYNENDEFFVGDKILNEFWKCEDCGICCKAFDEIPIYLEEIKQIAIKFNMSIKDFLSKYTSQSSDQKYKISLKTPCPFLKQDSCMIYSLRGLTCRIFPLCINLNGNQAVLNGIYFCPQATQFYEGLLDFMKNHHLKSYKKLIQKEKELMVDTFGMKMQGTADIFRVYLDWLYDKETD